MSLNNGTDASLSEAQKSVIKSKNESARRYAQQEVLHRRLVASGSALDLKGAFERCFDGSHGTEHLRGDGAH